MDASQELRSGHGPFARALNLKEADSAFAARHQGLVVEDCAGVAVPVLRARSQDFHALHALAEIGKEIGAWKGRQAPHMIVKGA